MLTRRQFTGRLAGGALVLSAGGATILLDACNSATIFADILAWIPTAKSAFAGIVTILGPFLPGGAQALIALVNASLDAVSAAVTEYNNAPAADKATLLGKIKVALQAVADNIQTFLNAFNIPGNPIIAVVIGLAQILLSTIAGFLGKLPVAAGGAKTIVRASVMFSGVSAPVVPKVRSISKFRSDWNSVCEAHGQTSIELN